MLLPFVWTTGDSDARHSVKPLLSALTGILLLHGGQQQIGREDTRVTPFRTSKHQKNDGFVMRFVGLSYNTFAFVAEFRNDYNDVCSFFSVISRFLMSVSVEFEGF